MARPGEQLKALLSEMEKGAQGRSTPAPVITLPRVQQKKLLREDAFATKNSAAGLLPTKPVTTLPVKQGASAMETNALRDELDAVKRDLGIRSGNHSSSVYVNPAARVANELTGRYADTKNSEEVRRLTARRDELQAEYDRREAARQAAVKSGDDKTRAGHFISSVGKGTGGAFMAIGDTFGQIAENRHAEMEANPNYGDDWVRLEALHSAVNDQATQFVQRNGRAPTQEEYNQLPLAAEYLSLKGKLDALAVNTPVSMDAPGMQMLTEAREHQYKASAGLPKAGRFVVDSGGSIAQNAALMTSAVIHPALPLIGMSTISAGNKMYDVSADGGSAESALMRGVVAGGIEAATEKIPLDNFLAMAKEAPGGIGGAIKNILEQAGTEATEEGISYVANYLADKVAQDPNATFSLQELGQSMAAGGFSGGVFGAGGSAIGAARGALMAGINGAQTYAERVSGAESAKSGMPKMNAADFTNSESPVWNNIAYEDVATQRAATQELHNSMVADGDVVSFPENSRVAESFPDLRTMNKQERTPILKQKIVELKADLRNFLRGVAKGNFEFEVNGNVLDAKLYDTGIREVLEKINKDKANMLYQSEEIFNRAKYLYSTPDYDGDPNVYRWNYFYTPVELGDGTTAGVRIAVRDIAQGEQHFPESQIYNWGIKKDATLGGGKPDISVSSPGTSSAASSEATLDGGGRGQSRGSSGISSDASSTPIIADAKTVGNTQFMQDGQKNSNFEAMGAASAGFDGGTYGQETSRIADTALKNKFKGTDLSAEQRAPYLETTRKTEKQSMRDATQSLYYETENGKTWIGDLFPEQLTQIMDELERAPAWDGVQVDTAMQIAERMQGQLLNMEITPEQYMDWASVMTDHATASGQGTQAWGKWSRTTGGQITDVQRSIQALQDELTAKYKDKAPNIEVDESLISAFLQATTADETAYAVNAIYKDIARQIPSTFADKWNAWRYLAMLGNAKTHVRNVAGNVAFAPMRLVKNVIGAGGEAVAAKLLPSVERTKAVLNPLSTNDRALIASAWQDAGSVQNELTGAGKYNDAKSKINEHRQIFKTLPLEAVRRFNNTALEAEDFLFSRSAYADSLAGYLKANGITAEQMNAGQVDASTMDRARSYAIKEAQKATYRDRNAFSDAVAGLGKTRSRVLNTVVEGVLPFKRTPANLVVRGLEYSPAGLVKGIYDGITKVRNGDMSASTMIDELSAGLSGTAVMALGAFLASQGLLSGGGDDDEKQAEFDKLQGSQQYALNIGDKSYTLDWLAPMSMPLFVGVEMYNALSEKQGGNALQDTLEAIGKVTEPILETSMLGSLEDTLSNISYADDKIMYLLANTTMSYLSQSVPTLFGQAARTMDNTRRRTYIDKESPLPSNIQYAVQKAGAKIPFVLPTYEPYVDEWGRTQKGSRAAENFILPFYTSKKKTTAMEQELQRLYDETGESVLPTMADKSFKYGNETYNLNAKEYTQYATTKGRMAFDTLTKMIDSAAYKKMSDAEKAKLVQAVYGYANDLAKRELLTARGVNYKSADWEKVYQAERIGVPLETYLKYRAMRDERDNTANRDALEKDTSMTDEQKEYLSNALLVDWMSIPKGKDVQYDNHETYVISQMSESAQRKWSENKDALGMTPDEYKTVWGIVKGDGKKDQKKEALHNAGYSWAMVDRIWNALN